MNNHTTVNGWHFSNGTLGYDDGRTITPGMALACKPSEIGLCDYGLHASIDILAALRNVPGSVLSYVECGGKIIRGNDKLVASQRRHLIVVNVERTLHEFACWCAERALSLIDNPDPRSVAAIETKRRWLNGNATDEELDTAADAAWNAARAADAAWNAVRSAWNAAADAAWNAARSAVAAARSADAAWNAVRAADAAWNAADWNAAADVQSKQLLSMILTRPEFTNINMEANHE